MVVSSVKKVAGTNMSSKQLLNYNNTRSKLFKGTIVVACIYAFIALLIILGLIFLESVRNVLGGSLYPFTVTLIVGMIFVIIILVIQVVKWTPTTTGMQYGVSDCPDYWDLTVVDEDDATGAYQETNDNYKPHVKFICKPRKDLYVSNTLTTPYVSTTEDGKSAQNDLMKHVNGTGYNSTLQSASPNKITCNQVFPSLLASTDADLYPDNPNATRCQFSRLCNVPWTSVCPNVPSDDVSND